INGLNKFVRYARKELDGKPLSDYEKDDIHHFGSWLKGFDLKNPLMIVDICTDSYNQQVLHAGTGSYNPIIVIFKDDQDNSRAAVGYVMSYYEFVEKGINRLDDSQWKKKLEEGVEHLRPEWTKSFLFSSKVKKPAEENFDNSRKSRTDLDLMSIEDRKKLIEKIKKEQQEARWKRHKKEIRENRKRLKQEKMKGITDPEKIAEIMLELSIEYSWSNDFNAAMQGYKEVISISPQGKAAKKALLKIAALLKCAYYNKKALKRFSMNASKQSPDLTQIQDIYTMVCYADIEVNEKDIVEAYMDVVKKYPRDNCAMEALKRLGDFYYKQTELEKALSYYKRLTRDFLTRYSVEKIIEIYSKLIIDHYWQKKYEEALKLHEEFISFIPYLALCSGSLELDIEAAGKVQIIKAGGGFDWQPLNLFTDAENRISLEDYQGAISVLEDIIESYPDWKLINNVHALRVLCCSITGKIKGSSQLELESMVKEKLLEDVRRKVFWRLGNVYRDRKDFIVAASAYQRALEVNDITWWDKKDILGLMAELRWETQGEVNLPPLMYDIKLSPEEISWSTDTDVPVRAEIHYGFDKNNLKNVFQWKGKIQTCHRESHYKVKISYQDPGNRKTTVIKGEKPFYLEPNKEYYLQIICESEEGVRGKSLKYSLFTDIEKPSVTLISPRRNAVLDGEVELEAEISDNTGIAEVVFGICKNQYSRELAYLTNPPFRTKVTLENIENGNYDLNVWAKDLYGNRANRGIDIRIMNSRGDITPPKVKIIFPQSGAELSGKVKMIAEAVDDHKMGYVKFFINGQDEGCVFRPPYEREWNTTFYYPTGYQIQAKAWDESDNVGESEIIRVTVKETPEHIARQKKYPQKNKLIEHMRKEMPRVRDGIHFVDLPDSIKIGVPTKISWKITRGSNIECTDLRWDYLSHLRNSVAIEYVNGYHYRGKKFSGKSGETFTDEILLVDEMLFYDTTKGSPIMLVIHATIDGQEVCSRLVNLYVIPESQK
ncbi:MAG: DUF3160 domain-containing protein, partial [Candidatus Aureabacteria bacterium]|nr:DUF3160 domain-containing protein [Candidatus Auribacterota bacterium]